MYYDNHYEYLNQEVRIPLLKVLEKYNLKKKDNEEIENILQYMFNQYEEMLMVGKFYEEKYGYTKEDFKEYMEYKAKHQKPIDYSKMSKTSVYDELPDEEETK